MKKHRAGKQKDEVDRLISLGVDAEFVKMLPPEARGQILNGILGLQDNKNKNKSAA